MCSRPKQSTGRKPCYCGIEKPTKPVQTKPAQSELCEKFKEFKLNNEHLRCFMRKLVKEIKKGLAEETHSEALIKSYVTNIQTLPKGDESGESIILEMNANKVRIVFLNLGSEEKYPALEKCYDISEELKKSTREELFDFLAQTLANFMDFHCLKESVLPLGFCFSFPVRPNGIVEGYLQRWTKGFNCPDVEGENVVELLQDAIAKRGDISFKFIILLNETIGTFVCSAHCNPNTKIGVVVGERCNGCYLENTEDAELFSKENEGDTKKKKKKVLVDVQWPCFGETGELDYIMTDYDKIIDEKSTNPGQEIFEKMVSTTNLGEIVRLALLKLTEEGVLFCGKPSDVLRTSGSFKTEFIYQIEADPVGRFGYCKKILASDLKIKHHKTRDYINVRFVCECVSHRAAYLISAAIATLLNKMNEKNVTIGVDGTLWRLHPFFEALVKEKVRELTCPEIEYDFKTIVNGAISGGAIMCAMFEAERAKEERLTRKGIA